MAASFSTILFDLDGTLVDSREDLTDAVNHALRTLGLDEKPASAIVPHVGDGLRMLLRGVLPPVDDESFLRAVGAFTTFYQEHCVDKTRLYPDVASTIDRLSKSMNIGVVTNKPMAFSRKILGVLGIENHVKTLIGGDSVSEKKPHPAPLLAAIKNLGGDEASALMVGDGVQDVTAGKNAGIKTCVARYGFGYRPETMALEPDFAINDFKEIKEILL